MSSFAVHMLRKPAMSHDPEDIKVTQMEDNTANDDSFEDAMNDPPSTHVDIFDLLSEASGQVNGTVSASNQTVDINSEETGNTPEEGKGAEDGTGDISASSSPDSGDKSSPTIAKSNLPFF